MKPGISIVKKDRALKEVELTAMEQDGATLIAVTTTVDDEYDDQCFAPGMPPISVRRWVYHFRTGPAR